MENSKASKVSFATIFGVASVWFGTHVGGGFATGNQAIQYYVQYGFYAAFMPLLAMGILAVVMREVMLMARTRNLYNYKDVFCELWAPYPKMEITMEIFYYLIVLAAVGSAIAGAASLFSDLGLPYGVSVCIIGAMLVVLTIFGAPLVAKASTVMSIGILVASFTMYFIGIAARSTEIATVFATAQGSGNFLTALWKAIVYSGFQGVSVPAMIACCGVLTTKASINKTSVLGFLMNGVALAVSCVMLLGWQTEVGGAGQLALPNLFVCKQMGQSWLYAFYFLSLFLAFISTCVTTIFGLVNRFENSLFKNKTEGAMSNIMVKRLIISIIVILVCMSISLIGLSNIVKYGYGYCGYIGLLFITIPVLTIGVKKNRQYMKDHPNCIQ